MISRLFLSQDPKQTSWSKVLWQWIPWVNYISLSKGVLKLQFLYWLFLHPAKIDRETQFPLFILLFSSELYHPYETFLLILTLSLFISPEIEIFFQPFNHFHSLSHKLLCSKLYSRALVQDVQDGKLKRKTMHSSFFFLNWKISWRSSYVISATIWIRTEIHPTK